MTTAHQPPAQPFFTVIVPVLDGGRPFRRCLDALSNGTFHDFELIVVDDGSSDASGAAAQAAGALVLETTGREGPAAARNLGALQARGEWLLFIDADCVPHADTLARMAAAISAGPWAEAVFGSYDAAPPAAGFVARYKNLMHHYVHQQGEREAFTFWAGCGAVRRSTFLEVGGFDPALYPRPCIEDIELGYRLRAGGSRIRLAADVQVTHQKAWTFLGMVRSDILDRGLPWARLIAARGALAPDLNLRWRDRVSGLLALAAAGALAATPLLPPAGLVAAASAGSLVVLNLDAYRYLAKVQGSLFAARAVPLHALYYAYATAAFAAGTVWGLADRLAGRGTAVPRSGTRRA